MAGRLRRRGGEARNRGARAAVRDSIVQRTGPAGRPTLLWNSWGRFALADCTWDGRLAEEYAHVNSLQAVECALYPAAGTATFLRDNALGGTRVEYARAQGHVELMDNGNRLVSWGIGPWQSVPEVDPGSGGELLAMRFTDPDTDVPVRAHPVRPHGLGDLNGRKEGGGRDATTWLAGSGVAVCGRCRPRKLRRGARLARTGGRTPRWRLPAGAGRRDATMNTSAERRAPTIA